jgi:hypothetical protein
MLLIKAIDVKILKEAHMSKVRNTTRRTQSGDVRRAHIPNLPLKKMSELGRDLTNLSREYESSGEELLTEEEIEIELAHRRGGYVQDNAA